MAKKKVTGEDGKTYVMKEKKPFYKKVWFWILAVIVIFIAAGALSGGGDEKNGGTKVDSADKSKTEETQKSDTSKESKEDDKFYKVGDTVRVGDATYTLKSVELTDERNEFEDAKPANVVKIDYTVENNGKEDIPVGTDVEVYDADNTKMDSYANENTMNSLAPGKKMEAVAHFAVEKTGDIEIHFSPLVSFEKAAIFKVNVQ